VVEELRRRGFVIHTLTNRARPPGASEITAAPLAFDEAHLVEQLRHADLFVNTFWVRLPWAGQDFSSAVARSELLLRAAATAGVGRIVHVSVSNAALGASLGYYGGKARVEEALRRLRRPYAIVRPTLVIGPNDVLSNNIAWLMRRFPVFLLPRGGAYRLQPVTLGDTAAIIADAALASGDLETDAAGPEVFTFAEYVRLLGRACGRRPWLLSAPNGVALAALRLLGPLLRDVVLTREELLGLEQELLVSHAPPVGRSSVSEWLLAHGRDLGRRYANDLHRHFGAGRGEPLVGLVAE
jgi:NADH dehydrogenase